MYLLKFTIFVHLKIPQLTIKTDIRSIIILIDLCEVISFSQKCIINNLVKINEGKNSEDFKV